ncbi:hypothetical protein WMF30_09690 [Sorangium sp. So ce134]
MPGLQVTQNGAWLLPDQTPLVPELEAFLAAGEPPVYVGFGSMPVAAATRSASRIAYLDEDYLDEDRLTALGVTFSLGPPGKGGIRRDDQGTVITGEGDVVVETLRFAESLDWRSPSEPRRWKPARPLARVQRRPWSDRSSTLSAPHHPGPPRQRGAPAGGAGPPPRTPCVKRGARLRRGPRATKLRLLSR